MQLIQTPLTDLVCAEPAPLTMRVRHAGGSGACKGATGGEGAVDREEDQRISIRDPLRHHLVPLSRAAVSENAHARVVIFIRTFSYTLRVAISLTVMQSTLSKHVLPAFMIKLFPPHQDPVPLSSSSPSSARRAAGMCSINCGDMGVIAGIVGASLMKVALKPTYSFVKGMEGREISCEQNHLQSFNDLLDDSDVPVHDQYQGTIASWKTEYRPGADHYNR
ncbi:hypothetical protein K439DRAFT_1621710 [Ramaria rubella]|nr:hypothetical protein K439DRAFT_1621710 [Ramaria rubella]